MLFLPIHKSSGANKIPHILTHRRSPRNFKPLHESVYVPASLTENITRNILIPYMYFYRLISVHGSLLKSLMKQGRSTRQISQNRLQKEGWDITETTFQMEEKNCVLSFSPKYYTFTEFHQNPWSTTFQVLGYLVHFLGESLLMSRLILYVILSGT